MLDGELSLYVEGEEHLLGQGALARVAPDVRRQLVNRRPQRVVLLALGGATDHSGRDGVAYASWDATVGAPPQEIPLPADVPVEPPPERARGEKVTRRLPVRPTLESMPEGDTILRAANRIRPVLEGVVPDEIVTPQARHARDRWPERLRGRAVTRVDTHGKHLFLRFEGDLVLHSHLRMTGAWAVYRHGARWRRAPRRAWLVIRARGHEVVEFDGPVLELMTGRPHALRPAARGARPGRAGRARSTRDRFLAPPARRRPDARDRRRAARPADRRRPRQHLEGRGLLGRAARPVAPAARRLRRRRRSR